MKRVDAGGDGLGRGASCLDYIEHTSRGSCGKPFARFDLRAIRRSARPARRATPDEIDARAASRDPGDRPRRPDLRSR